MKEDEEEEDKCNKDEDIAFGMSSFLFLIPWAYAQFTFQKAFSIWTISLLLLVCNSYPVDKKCQIVDHTVIIALSMIYFIYHRRLFVPILLYILYVMELCFTNDTKNTVIISFVSLNLFAFTNFTRQGLSYLRLQRCANFTEIVNAKKRTHFIRRYGMLDVWSYLCLRRDRLTDFLAFYCDTK